MSYLQAVSYTLLGAGVTVFSSLFFERRLRHAFTRLMKYWPGHTRKHAQGFNPRLRKVLIFYRRYGFWGLMLLTPILIGLPVGTLLARRLGSSRTRITVTVMMMSLGWSSLAFLLARSGLAQLGF